MSLSLFIHLFRILKLLKYRELTGGVHVVGEVSHLFFEVGSARIEPAPKVLWKLHVKRKEIVQKSIQDDIRFFDFQFNSLVVLFWSAIDEPKLVCSWDW